MRVEGLLAAFPKLVASETAASAHKQHTYVETDTVRCVRGKECTRGRKRTSLRADNRPALRARRPRVRYVYAPVETTMYLVLITNKGSNIIEDLDTLRLVGKVREAPGHAPRVATVPPPRAFTLAPSPPLSPLSPSGHF